LCNVHNVMGILSKRAVRPAKDNVWRIHERRKCRRNKGIGNSTGQPPARSLPSPA
jgi:hypothetical protein